MPGARKKPLKHFLSGMEFEFFLLDSKGFVSFNADEVIRKTKALDQKISIVKECAKNMVELNHYPKIEPHETMAEILRGYHVLVEAADSLDTLVFPLGTYPGSFKPVIRSDPIYAVKKKIFGQKKMDIAGRNIGFHYHHTMPKGVFDRGHMKLRKLADSQMKSVLLSSYNLLIALDPALTTITQSSPYYQGKYYGKDSRLFWYRGGKKLKFSQGLYAKYPLVGALPPYKQTIADLNYSISRRYQFWKKQIKKAGLPPETIGEYKSILDLSWNPVKVNKHDTLEQRGMDMNYLDCMLGVTTTLNFVLNRVQKDYLQVMPSDIGLDEPFKVEGNIMHIPPHTFVRNKLQYWAAKEGFENTAVSFYCKRFIKFAKQCVPPRFKNLSQPVYDIVARQRSASDRLLSKAKKKGFKSFAKIPDDFAAELALGSVETANKKAKKTARLLKKLL